jgi:hypothetical protein
MTSPSIDTAAVTHPHADELLPGRHLAVLGSLAIASQRSAATAGSRRARVLLGDARAVAAQGGVQASG